MKKNILLSLICLFIPLLLFAGTTGKITGRIIDKDTGDALPMVNVVVLETTMGAVSDLEGYFTILQIPPGTYSVKATMMGFEKLTMTNVKVSVDLTTTLNFKLRPTVMDLGTEVTVVADRPIVQKDVTSSSHHLSADVIKNMPTMTSVRDLMAAQPGVVGEGIHINIRGGRTGEVRTIVDGMGVSDPLYRQATRTTQEQVAQFTSNPVDELSGRTGGVAVPMNAIAQVEVITGGFNAEYGQAMSGIVNIVTKEGGPRISGRLQYLTDDLGQGEFKTHTENGSGLRAFSHNTDKMEFSLGGPEPITRYLLPALGIRLPFHVYFFTSGTGNFTDVSTAYDLAYYAPTGEDRSDELRDKIWGIPLPFEYGNRMDNLYNSLSNLSIRFSPSHKITISYGAEQSWYDEYNHAFKNLPENFWQREESNKKVSLKWSHTLSAKTFYELMLGYNETYYLFTPGGMTPPEVYELWDSLIEPIGDDKGANALDDDHDGFYDRGYPSRGTWHERTTERFEAKIDLTSQLHRHHQLKTGLEIAYFKMQHGEIKYPSSYHPDEILDSGPWPEYGIFRDFYSAYPTTGAFYIQDKIEYETLIVNAGIRFDFQIPGKEVNEKIEEGNKVPGTGIMYKSTINPRLGISHPITERDNLYFYFGRFSQPVDWNFVYMKDTQTSGAFKLYGNPNLSSEEVTQYEVGVVHAFNDVLSLKLTGYFKDYSGLINTETRGEIGYTYSVYINRDYGNARGFEISLEKRYSNYVSGNIHYTFTNAMGKSSSYRQGYDFSYKGSPIPIKEWPLDWDVPHALNLLFDFRVLKGQAPALFGRKIIDNWGFNLVWHIESGKPYTPEGLAATQYTTHNSARTPYRTWVNVKFNKDFSFWSIRNSFIIEINNLFDRRNVRAVNKETGDIFGLMREQDVSAAFYSAGRNILVGMAIEF